MSKTELIKHYENEIAKTNTKIIGLLRSRRILGNLPIIAELMQYVLKNKNVYLRNLKQAERESQ
jgi:hypothetical protein